MEVYNNKINHSENKENDEVNLLTNKMNLIQFKNDENQYSDKSSLQDNFKSFMKMRKVYYINK